MFLFGIHIRLNFLNKFTWPFGWICSTRISRTKKKEEILISNFELTKLLNTKFKQIAEANVNVADEFEIVEKKIGAFTKWEIWWSCVGLRGNFYIVTCRTQFNLIHVFIE